MAALQTSQLILVNKIKACASMNWVQALEGDGKTAKREMLDEVKQQGLRYGVLYQSSLGTARTMYGLVGRDPPKGIVGAVPVATWLAEVVQKPTVYIESLKDKGARYWILAAMPGKIHAATDQVASDTDAKRLIEGILSDYSESAEVDFVVGADGGCPSSNVIERHKRRRASLAELLGNEAPKDAQRIKQHTGITPGVVMAFLAFIGLAVLSVGGYFMWSQYKAKKEQEAFMAMQMQTQGVISGDVQALSDKSVRLAVEKALKEDTATIHPSTFISACVSGTDDFPKRLGGWTLTKISCNVGGVSATYSITGTQSVGQSAETFMAAATADGYRPQLAFGGIESTITVPFQGMTVRDGLALETLPRLSEASVYLPSRGQMVKDVVSGLEVRFEAPAPKAVTYEDPIQTAQQQGAPVMLPVPEASSYLSGTFKATGAQLAQLFSLDWTDAFLTVETMEFTPKPEGGFAFAMTGKYVMAVGG